uniref:Uncharacterized protein n=1 Tax=Larimichthys crocea TaxID=215358 RepID=A0A0F8AWN0_LARCR
MSGSLGMESKITATSLLATDGTSIPYVPSLKQLHTLTTNPFIKQTYKTWSELRRKTRSDQPLYNLTPFHTNPLLPKVLRDGITQVWFTKGIKTFGDLYKDGAQESFEDLVDKYGLDQRHFFKFLQLRHYIRSEQGGRLLPVTVQPLDNTLSSKKELKGYLTCTMALTVCWEKKCSRLEESGRSTLIMILKMKIGSSYVKKANASPIIVDTC